MFRTRAVSVCVVLTVLLLLVSSPALAADPVTLNNVDIRVVVLGDGRLDVRYTLTFTENESRDRISYLGPFATPHEIVASSGEGPDGPFTVTAVPSDRDNHYQINFERRTRQGEQYDVMVRYTVDRSVFDETTVDGVEYRAIGWAPFQWDLPIEKMILQYVLPVELPADVTTPEQVTDEVVDATGLLVTDTSDFERWVYFVTPDEEAGKNWLSIHVEKHDLPPRDRAVPVFYLPATLGTATRETPVPPRTATPIPGPRASRTLDGISTLPLAGLAGVVIVAGALFIAHRRREARLPAAAADEETKRVTSDALVCPLCGAANAADAGFCTACGGGLGAILRCRLCGTQNAVDARFCKGCGTRLDESNG